MSPAPIRHSVTKDEYSLRPDGRVEVRSPTGAVGVFTRAGQWVSGDLKHADAHMLEWVSDSRTTFTG
jgi:hypothetical protein